MQWISQEVERKCRSPNCWESIVDPAVAGLNLIRDSCSDELIDYSSATKLLPRNIVLSVSESVRVRVWSKYS